MRSREFRATDRLLYSILQKIWYFLSKMFAKYKFWIRNIKIFVEDITIFWKRYFEIIRFCRKTNPQIMNKFHWHVVFSLKRNIEFFAKVLVRTIDKIILARFCAYCENNSNNWYFICFSKIAWYTKYMYIKSLSLVQLNAC